MLLNAKRFAETPLIQQFVEFVEAQPADRQIKSHDSWNECAVGDFMREMKGHEVPLARVSENGRDSVAFVALRADEMMSAFVNQLQLHGSLEYAISSPYKAPGSYGDFLEKINEAIELDDLG